MTTEGGEGALPVGLPQDHLVNPPSHGPCQAQAWARALSSEEAAGASREAASGRGARDASRGRARDGGSRGTEG